jgi:hypothetical protein
MTLGQRFNAIRTSVLAAPDPDVDSTITDAYALRTYRYVRVMIIALTVGLLTAVVVEWATAGCALGSISAYYYTPAHGLFAGGLIGIGVCLIAIRDQNDLQDGLLNLAGLLGPMVALIPMHLNVGTAADPSRQASCITGAQRISDLRPTNVQEVAFGLVTGGRLDAIRNNVFALLVMLALGLVLMGGLIWRSRTYPGPSTPTPKWWPCWLAVGMTVGVLLVYRCAYGFFIERVHFLSAGLMFLAVSLFAIVDGIRARSVQGASKRGLAYIALGSGLIAGCLTIILIGRHNTWTYTTLTAELWGISLFLAFWIIQTIDLWNHTSRTGAILATSSGDTD